MQVLTIEYFALIFRELANLQIWLLNQASKKISETWEVEDFVEDASLR